MTKALMFKIIVFFSDMKQLWLYSNYLPPRPKMPDFAPTLKGDQAFSTFAPFRVGANKGRKCRVEINLNSYPL